MKRTGNRLISAIKSWIVDYFSRGHERSIRAKKNIIISFCFKGMDMLIGLVLVPIVLNYLGQERYGIWLTMSSIVALFGFMNVGLGHGLRNKFAEAKTKGENIKARKYVSTTYALLSLIILAFFCFFFAINFYLPWDKILNTNTSLEHELYILAIIVFGSFSLKLVFQLITTLLVADQKPSTKDGLDFVGKVLVLMAILILSKSSNGSLIYIGIIYTCLPLAVLLISSLVFYNSTYKLYRPSFKFVDFTYSRDIIDLGWKFFIIQISAMVLFTSDNVIITQLFTPDQVVPYQIVYKYFGIILIIFTILISPMWSAYTEAYINNDIKWIKNAIKKQKKIWYTLMAIVCIMILASNEIYKIWVGGKINIDKTLSISWAIFIALQTYNMIYTHFLNGIGKIKLQMLTAISSILLNIPMSILLARYLGMGLPGVITATSISIVLYTVTRKIQYSKIINGSANGIWND